MILYYLIQLFKGPISKYTHIPRYWGLECQYEFGGDKIQTWTVPHSASLFIYPVGICFLFSGPCSAQELWNRYCIAFGRTPTGTTRSRLALTAYRASKSHRSLFSWHTEKLMELGWLDTLASPFMEQVWEQSYMRGINTVAYALSSIGFCTRCLEEC